MDVFNIEDSKIEKSDLLGSAEFIESYSATLEKFRLRSAGSVNETAAARSIRNTLAKRTGSKVRLEAFRAYQLLGRGLLLLLGLWYLLSYALYFVSFAGNGLVQMLLTLLSLIVFTVGVTMIILIYLGKGKARNILAQKVSYNVVAESKEFSENAERIFIIADNHDCDLDRFTSEYKFLSDMAKVFVPLTAIVFVIFCILKAVIGTGTTASVTAFSVVPAVVGVMGISVTLVRYFMSGRKSKQNNGIATSIALETFTYFMRRPNLIPEDVRLVYASFGAENSGHGGSEAFVKAHPEFASATVLCLENIEDGNVRIVDRNVMRRITYSVPFASLVSAAASEQKIAISTLPTDTVAQKLASVQGYLSDNFAKNGNPTATLIAENNKSDNQTVDRNDLFKIMSVTVGTVMKYFSDTPPAQNNDVVKEQETEEQVANSTEMEIHAVTGK